MTILLLLIALLCPALAQAQLYYLATYEGMGTDADPFRAHSNIPGTDCKSLRANEAQQAGYALCSGPSLPVRAGVHQIDLGAVLTAQQKTFLANVLGRTVTETTVGEVLSAIVDMNSLSLKRGRDGQQRLVIKGREVWSRPAPLSSYVPEAWERFTHLFVPSSAWAATTLDEDWNCADDNTPSYFCDHTWVRYSGTTAELITNSLRNVNSVGTNLLYNDSTLDSTDMLHRVTVSSISRGTATNVSGGAGARHTGTSTSTYVYCVARDAATQQVAYGHVVAGSNTEDGAVSATLANGDIIEVRAVGDQLSCKHNGTTVLGPITENTGSGNVNVMVRFSGSGTATTTLVSLDDSHAEVVVPGRRAVAPLVFP